MIWCIGVLVALAASSSGHYHRVPHDEVPEKRPDAVPDYHDLEAPGPDDHDDQPDHGFDPYIHGYGPDPDSRDPDVPDHHLDPGFYRDLPDHRPDHDYPSNLPDYLRPGYLRETTTDSPDFTPSPRFHPDRPDYGPEPEFEPNHTEHDQIKLLATLHRCLIPNSVSLKCAATYLLGRIFLVTEEQRDGQLGIIALGLPKDREQDRPHQFDDPRINWRSGV